MKSLEEIDALLGVFEKEYGFKTRGHQQLSEVWFQTRLGVITASEIHRAVASRSSETRATYMAELVAEICTGTWEEISSKYMDWGRQHEDSARSFYEFQTDYEVQQIPFVFKDTSYRTGCSADGIVSLTKGTEIKCPWSSANYVKFLVSDSVKPEWKWQQQGTLWVMNADEWDFVQYDPRMKKSPMKIMTTAKDPEKQKVLDDTIPLFIEDMDKMLEKIGIPFGEQWRRLAGK